jgi:hemolysin activation/secretion protein
VDSPVKYPPFTLQYSATWLGANAEQHTAIAGGRSNTNLQVGVSFLIQGLGTDWREFANKRSGAGTSYVILHPTLSREQILPWKWSLAGTLDGQIASGPLINNEQYSAGGADTVRGYTEAERLGDNAARASLELRTPQLFAGRIAHLEDAYSFLFADGAKLHTIQPLPGEEANFTLASAGLGLKFKAAGLAIQADAARILKSGYVTPAARYRGVFSVSYAF